MSSEPRQTPPPTASTPRSRHTAHLHVVPVPQSISTSDHPSAGHVTARSALFGRQAAPSRPRLLSTADGYAPMVDADALPTCDVAEVALSAADAEDRKRTLRLFDMIQRYATWHHACTVRFADEDELLYHWRGGDILVPATLSTSRSAPQARPATPRLLLVGCYAPDVRHDGVQIRLSRIPYLQIESRPQIVLTQIGALAELATRLAAHATASTQTPARYAAILGPFASLLSLSSDHTQNTALDTSRSARHDYEIRQAVQEPVVCHACLDGSSSGMRALTQRAARLSEFARLEAQGARIYATWPPTAQR